MEEDKEAHKYTVDPRSIQMLLDRHIYDYLVSRNMHTVADTFAKEANFDPKDDTIYFGGASLLREWWALLWDVYLSRPGNNHLRNQSSKSSWPHQSSASVPMIFQPNAHLPGSPVPDPNQPLLQVYPTTLPPRSYSCHTKQPDYRQQSPAGFETAGAKETYHISANSSGTSNTNSQSADSGL